jgi:hypothetical protein
VLNNSTWLILAGDSVIKWLMSFSRTNRLGNMSLILDENNLWLASLDG